MVKKEKSEEISLSELRKQPRPPKNEFEYMHELSKTDIGQLKGKLIVLSKDVMLGNIKDPDMLALVHERIDILVNLGSMAEIDPYLREFFFSEGLAFLAKFRSTRALGGSERAGYGSPFGGWGTGFGSYGMGMPEPEQKGDLFGFLKGKKLLGGQAPNPGNQVGKGGW